MDNIILVLEKVLLAIIPSIGFGILFNVPLRVLKYCALLGAIGYGFRLLLILMGIHIEWASFCAAILVGWIGIECSRKWLLAHPKVFTVAAIIPMFPGIDAYMAMTSAVKLAQVGYNGVIFEALVTHFLRASFVVGALSIGLSLPGIWLYRIRRNNI